MINYSPYDNVEAKAYPNMLVKTSFNDSQVMYWEPAKYVAKTRATRTDHNNLIFKVNLKSGWPRRRIGKIRPPPPGVLRLRLHPEPNGNHKLSLQEATSIV